MLGSVGARGREDVARAWRMEKQESKECRRMLDSRSARVYDGVARRECRRMLDREYRRELSVMLHYTHCQSLTRRLE
jgi:hypothetical protein